MYLGRLLDLSVFLSAILAGPFSSDLKNGAINGIALIPRANNLGIGGAGGGGPAGDSSGSSGNSESSGSSGVSGPAIPKIHDGLRGSREPSLSEFVSEEMAPPESNPMGLVPGCK